MTLVFENKGSSGHLPGILRMSSNVYQLTLGFRSPTFGPPAPLGDRNSSGHAGTRTPGLE